MSWRLERKEGEDCVRRLAPSSQVKDRREVSQAGLKRQSQAFDQLLTFFRRGSQRYIYQNIAKKRRIAMCIQDIGMKNSAQNTNYTRRQVKAIRQHMGHQNV
jgi:hypothetical protein